MKEESLTPQHKGIKGNWIVRTVDFLPRQEFVIKFSFLSFFLHFPKVVVDCPSSWGKQEGEEIISLNNDFERVTGNLKSFQQGRFLLSPPLDKVVESTQRRIHRRPQGRNCLVKVVGGVR